MEPDDEADIEAEDRYDEYAIEQARIDRAFPN